MMVMKGDSDHTQLNPRNTTQSISKEQNSKEYLQCRIQKSRMEVQQ